MSNTDGPGRWIHRGLTLALLVLGVAVMALLYALVSQNVSSGSGAPSGEGPAGASDPVSEAASAPSGEIIQVGVQNGCGVDDVAAETRGYLVGAGFDVVDVGNHSSSDLDSSLVIDRVGNLRAARRVAAALGISRQRVRQDISSEYYLDASVLIGNDYRMLTPFRNDKSAR